MSVPLLPTIDLIRELRLRQWARAHYTSEDQRSATWHPIVLDEMRRRDEELLHAGVRATAARSIYVPLAPNNLNELAEAS